MYCATLCLVTIKGVCNTFMYTLRHYCPFHRLRFESKTNQAKIKIRIQFLAWCIVMHDEVHACMCIITQLLCWKNGNIYTHTFLGRATIHCLFRENFVQGRNPVEKMIPLNIYTYCFCFQNPNFLILCALIRDRTNEWQGEMFNR